jgi:glycosyltransferase involved in cell wall biosynthesis
MEALLTIAIPTYNRPVQLRYTLEVVLPQILGDNRVRLLVLDNHSEVPAAQILNELGVELNEKVSVIRHALNIGGNANIMRCFELCETEWVWVLSDDDNPSSDAVQIILDDSKGAHCFAFYSYPAVALTKPIPNGKMSGQTIDALFKAVDYRFTPMTMLSACIYRMGVLRKRLSKGYCCMNSGLPHLAMAFAEIESGGEWLLLEQTICDYNPPTREHTWMYYAIFLGLPIAFLSLTHLKSTSSFRRCLQVVHGSCPAWLLVSFLNGFENKSLFSRQSAYFFRIMKAYYMPSVFSHPLDWINWQFMTIASFFPGIFWRSVCIVCGILKRPFPFTGTRERGD